MVASLPYPPALSWVTAIAGAPAGVIVFLLGLSVIYYGDNDQNKIFQYKNKVPQQKRLLPAFVGSIIAVTILITSSTWLPKGVGGVMMIVIVLSAANFIRRTPYEIELTMKGLPDMRGVTEDEDLEYDEDEYEYYEEYYEDDYEYDDVEYYEDNEGQIR